MGFWDDSIPMSFEKENWSYEQKRQFRYGLQDYMHDSFHFNQWAEKKILEIGCGSGIDSVEFARNGANVIASDITPNAIKLTVKLAKEAKVKVKTLLLRDNKLPFSSASFDCVYSHGILHHIPDVDSIVKEIYRVLKSGGYVMSMLYHKNSLLYIYSILYLGNETERNKGCPYVKCYTKEEAKDLFRKHGFNNIAIDVRYNVIDTPTQRKVKLGISDNYELGWHLVVKGQK